MTQKSLWWQTAMITTIEVDAQCRPVPLEGVKPFGFHCNGVDIFSCAAQSLCELEVAALGNGGISSDDRIFGSPSSLQIPWISTVHVMHASRCSDDALAVGSDQTHSNLALTGWRSRSLVSNKGFTFRSEVTGWQALEVDVFATCSASSIRQRSFIFAKLRDLCYTCTCMLQLVSCGN